MKSKIFSPKFVDLIIWFLILILFIYEGFIGKVESKIVWLIAIILITISLIIKLIFIGK